MTPQPDRLRATLARLRRVNRAIAAWDEYEAAVAMPEDVRPAVARPEGAWPARPGEPSVGDNGHFRRAARGRDVAGVAGEPPELSTGAFDAWLCERMAEHGVRSPEHLGREIGVFGSTVRGWLAGGVRPERPACRKLAERFGVPLGEVLAFVGRLSASAGTDEGTVGDRLRRLREARGWSQPDLGREAGMAAHSIWAVETGHKRLGTAAGRELAAAHGCEPADVAPRERLSRRARRRLFGPHLPPPRRPHLRRLRVAAGLTQGGLAARVGMSRQVISYHERGRFTPTAGALRRLAEALGVGPEDGLG
jgi:transcriptional regulator with XRE-family HTH domain